MLRGRRSRGLPSPCAGVADQRVYNSPKMKLQVECYSGYKAEERPVIFRIDGHEYRVEEVLDQWYGPTDAWFKVRVHDGNLYILRRRTCVPHSEWDLVSFRQAAG